MRASSSCQVSSELRFRLAVMRLGDSPRCPEVRFEEAPRCQTSSVRFHLLEPRLNVAAGAADASRAMVLTSCSKVVLLTAIFAFLWIS